MNPPQNYLLHTNDIINKNKSNLDYLKKKEKQKREKAMRLDIVVLFNSLFYIIFDGARKGYPTKSKLMTSFQSESSPF